MTVSIKIPCSLIHLVGHNQSVTVEAVTVAEVLSELFNTYPQLYIHFADKDTAASAILLLNGKPVTVSDLPTSVNYGDYVELETFIPSGSEGISEVVSTFVVDAILDSGLEASTAYAFASAANMAITGILPAAIGMGISYALSAIIGSLTDDVASPYASISGFTNSATYTFDGVRNTTASGTPFQVVYGQHRVGGQILNLFIRHTVDGYTDLYYQIGLCEGEIGAVSDVQINKLPSDYYNAVAYDFRVGSELQEIMPAFNEVDSTVTISRHVI